MMNHNDHSESGTSPPRTYAERLNMLKEKVTQNSRSSSSVSRARESRSPRRRRSKASGFDTPRWVTFSGS